MGRHIGSTLSLRQLQAPAQQLHPPSICLRQPHIRQVQSRDSLCKDLSRQNLPAKGQIRQDADLAAGVHSLHISGGIRLRIALFLGLLQRFGKGGTAAVHPGEDIVGGAIEDAVDFFNLIGGHTLYQRTKDGNSPAHTGFKEVADMITAGQFQQLMAFFRHQFLVGGNHVLAGLKGPPGIFICRLHASDGLHHHLDLRVLLDLREIIGHQRAIGIVTKMPYQNFTQLQGFSQLVADGGAIVSEHLGHTASHCAEAQNGDLCHHIFLFPNV